MDNFRKAMASNSQGACVEVGNSRKATYSMNNGACVEAGNGGGRVIVRDTAEAGIPDRTAVGFTGRAWREFTASLRG
jgi:hypothetical protein